MIFLSQGYRIDQRALTVTNSTGYVLNIRPKTCQLLVLLLQNAGKSVSKEQMLSQVWSDSVVAEQVVFQSVNEIRQVFNNKEVIKTVPKQGYVWLPEVVEAPLEQPTKKSKKTSVGLALVAVFSLLFMLLWQQFNWSQIQTVTGSVIVTPTINQVQGNDHNWVRLGMMDQLIQRLPNSEEHGVLQTDYVLEVLKRAQAKFATIDENEIEQLFVVSGAELIVTSLLSGSPHDYQLNYRFYSRSSVNQGVLFGSDMQKLIDNFSDLIAKQMGDKALAKVDYHADFNNELMARAMELRLARDYQAAQPLLQSLVINEPENITARRILANNLMALRQAEQSLEQLELAIPMAKQQNDNFELTRLLLSKAYLANGSGDIAKAKVLAGEALTFAQESKDWLYMAFIKNLLAQIAIKDEDYMLAESLFIEAKEHHQVLKCPVGETISWGHLALLAKRQEQPEKFTELLSKAEQIATSRELTRQLTWIHNIKQSH